MLQIFWCKTLITIAIFEINAIQWHVLYIDRYPQKRLINYCFRNCPEMIPAIALKLSQKLSKKSKIAPKIRIVCLETPQSNFDPTKIITDDVIIFFHSFFLQPKTVQDQVKRSNGRIWSPNPVSQLLFGTDWNLGIKAKKPWKKPKCWKFTKKQNKCWKKKQTNKSISMIADKSDEEKYAKYLTT